MHTAFGQSNGGAMSTALWRASFPQPRPDPTLRLVPVVPILAPVERSAGYVAQRQPNWIAIAFILVAHAVLLFALIKFDVISVAKPKSKPLVVNLVMLPADPSDGHSRSSTGNSSAALNSTSGRTPPVTQ